MGGAAKANENKEKKILTAISVRNSANISAKLQTGIRQDNNASTLERLEHKSPSDVWGFPSFKLPPFPRI